MLTGECYCGEVSYQIDGDLITMYHCHCSRCRKLSGASFATNGSLEARLFNITKGQNNIISAIHDGHYRYHCKQCHSWIYGESEDYQGLRFIPCGTLNETPTKQVDHHVCVDSKADWIKIDDQLLQYSGRRPKQE